MMISRTMMWIQHTAHTYIILRQKRGGESEAGSGNFPLLSISVSVSVSVSVAVSTYRHTYMNDPDS